MPHQDLNDESPHQPRPKKTVVGLGISPASATDAWLQLLKRFKAHAWNHDWGILGQLPCNLARTPPKIFGLTSSLPSVSGWTSTPGITLGISQSLGLSCLISRYSCWDLPRRSSRGGREGLGQPAGEKSSLRKLTIYGWWMIYSKGGEIFIYIILYIYPYSGIVTIPLKRIGKDKVAIAFSWKKVTNDLREVWSHARFPHVLSITANKSWQ